MRYHNNPANIRYSVNNAWKGLAGSDNGFCVFESCDFGVRALVILLRKYICVYKKKTVQEIISRYAPASENDTSNYVAFVESVLVKHGYDPNHIVYLSPAFVWLCIAICRFETNTRYGFEEFLEICRKFHLSI